MFTTLASLVVLSITTVVQPLSAGRIIKLSSERSSLRALKSLGCRLVVVVLALLGAPMILVRAQSPTSSGRRAFLRASSTEAGILGMGMHFVVTAKLSSLMRTDCWGCVRRLDERFITH